MLRGIIPEHGAGTLSRTNRTPRQQLQNKQAQQRYRERRKMKVTEMEQALAAMSQQVDELQGVLKQNVALQVCPLTLSLRKPSWLNLRVLDSGQTLRLLF